MVKTVLLSAPYMLPNVNRFLPIFNHYNIELIQVEVNERLSENELLKISGKFDGVISGDDRFTEKVLQTCLPRLKVISKWGTGIDSIDCVAAKRLGIQVRNTTNAFTLPVSDSVMGYMLSFARQLPWMDKSVKSGEWQKLRGRSLCECTLGVVGVGNIGKAVFRRAKAFGMRLLGNDIIPIESDFISENRVEMTDLKSLLEQSDFVSLNCTLTSSSHHIINARTLGYMKPDSILINIARGPLVDESALVEALKAGKIAGAALDLSLIHI